MQVIAFDTETTLIKPAFLAPPLVCMTWCVGSETALVRPEDAKKTAAEWFCGGAGPLVVGHNVSFDLAVLCEASCELVAPVFQALADNRVTDTMIREQLLDIAGGKYRYHPHPSGKGKGVKVDYSLASVGRRRAGLHAKKDGFRFFYALFIDTPLDQWADHAREVQARAVAFEAGGADAGLADIKAILGDKWGEAVAGLIAADPAEVLTYPVEDAVVTDAVYWAQEDHADELDDQYRQTRAAFWLHLSSAWGLRTTAERIRRLKTLVGRAYESIEAELVEAEIVRANGTRNTKAAKRLMIDVCLSGGLPLRRTDSHGESPGKCKDLDGNVLEDGDELCAEHISLDEDACKTVHAASEHPGALVLGKYAEASTLKKVLANNIPALERGVYWPIHTHYGLGETGRTTSSNPPIQNLTNLEIEHEGVKLGGIRETFVPRAGHLYASCDFPQLENYAWAQCCVTRFGHSKMAEALNAGLDTHVWYAGVILDTDYEDALAQYTAGDVFLYDLRQVCKAGNFGWAGGMGVPKFTRHLRRTLKRETVARLGLTDIKVAEAKVQVWRDKWFEAWPEAHDHFARVRGLLDPIANVAKVATVFTNRIRGGAPYCAACNNDFQGLGVDCAKEAGWQIAVKQYTDRHSALFNTRTVFFVHDEFGLECRDDARAHEVAYELADTMRTGANKYLPDVPIPKAKMHPVLMREWSKKAKPVFSEGRLIPWQ